MFDFSVKLDRKLSVWRTFANSENTVLFWSRATSSDASQKSFRLLKPKFYPFWSETFRIMINCYNIGCFIGWLPYFQWCSETKNSSFWYGLDVSLFMISKWNIFNRRKNNMWFKISKSFLLLHFEHLLWSSFWPLEFISRLPMISLQILQK